MQRLKKLTKLLILLIFVLTFSVNNIKTIDAANLSNDYEDGRLIKLKDVQGGAVYEIGSDGKKYVYPDQKTYNTWHDDFSEVEEVEVEELDNYESGGNVIIQPGSKLITHPYTAKIYAVATDGEILHVPSEAKAKELFGDNWVQNVEDVDAGIFAVSYKNKGKELSEDNLPNGALVNEKGSEELFLIENNQKRAVNTNAYGVNRLYKKMVTNVDTLSNNYELGIPLEIEETKISHFDPDDNNEQIVICHIPPGNETNPQTIKISERALNAHLKHGDTIGACVEEEEEKVSCFPDFNGDGQVNLSDFSFFSGNYGLTDADNNYDLLYDVNNDGAVNDYDKASFDNHYNQPFECGVDVVDEGEDDDPEDEEDEEDIGCSNTYHEVREPEYNSPFKNLGLDTSKYPNIVKYRIKWIAGHWSPWYVPGENDIYWRDTTVRVWSLFFDHVHEIVWCGTPTEEEEYDDNNPINDCANPVTEVRPPTGKYEWQLLGLDTSSHPEIVKYQIRWFAGHWSSWFTPGDGDIDWKLSTRRVWSYFDDHEHKVMYCPN